jgi:mgtE-like transporter
MSAFALFFGHLFWGITPSDFPAILSVVVATMALGLTLFLVTVKVAFVSFKRGLDPDIVVYPVMSSVAGVLITVFYVVALNLFFLFGAMGQYVLVILGLVHLLFVAYVFPRNLHEQEFIKTLKESLAAIIFVSLIVNITGTILRRISFVVRDSRAIFTVYPALISMISDVGSVVGSTATTKLALGLLTPSFSSIRNHAKNVFSAWTASIMMFIILAASALAIHGLFSLVAFSNIVSVLLVTNVIAVVTIIILSYAISILTFKKGLNPGNFVIPIESAFSASVTSIALLVALFLVG